MKTIFNDKLLSSSSVSSDDKVGRKTHIFVCDLAIKKRKKKVKMDYFGKGTSIRREHKMPSFITGFHHKAYLENIQTNYYQSRIKNYRARNCMLPPIPYISHKTSLPPSPRTKLHQLRNENLKVYVSRSTSPINLKEENDVINTPTIQEREDNTYLNPYQTECNKSNEAIGKKEKPFNIIKEIPLNLLNESQRSQILNDQNLDQTVYPRKDSVTVPKTRVIEQILYFNEKSKLSNDNLKLPNQNNSLPYIPSQTLHMKREPTNYPLNAYKNNYSNEKKRNYLMTKHDLSNSLVNCNKTAKVVNKLFSDYSSSGSVSLTNSAESTSFACSEKTNSENRHLFSPKLNNSQFRRDFRKKPSETHDGVTSIIDTIKSKFFPNVKVAEIKQDDRAFKEANLKFPKETRNAMLMHMDSNSKKLDDIKEPRKWEGVQVRRLKSDKKKDFHVRFEPQVQTEVRMSCTRTHEDVFKNSAILPCPKDLLCQKGVHKGRCKKSHNDWYIQNCPFEDRLIPSCKTCHSECQNVWSGSPRRHREPQEIRDDMKNDDSICYGCQKFK